MLVSNTSIKGLSKVRERASQFYGRMAALLARAIFATASPVIQAKQTHQGEPNSENRKHVQGAARRFAQFYARGKRSPNTRRAGDGHGQFLSPILDAGGAFGASERTRRHAAAGQAARRRFGAVSHPRQPGRLDRRLLSASARAALFRPGRSGRPALRLSCVEIFAGGEVY